eukprot:1234848-Alexandrium_andersonii.AAC.1
MSASLVGSEMCIRDSQRSRSAWALAPWCPARWLSQHRSPSSSEVRAATVSYTHLTLPTICSV